MKLARLDLLFILTLCGLTPLSEAQPAGRPCRIGVLHTVFFPSTPAVEGLKAGLKAQGLEEGSSPSTSRPPGAWASRSPVSSSPGRTT